MIHMAQHIYAQLQDDISREIFMARLEYSITREIRSLKRIFDAIGLSSRILHKMNCGKRLILFGAGVYGDRLVDLYPEISWAAFTDNNSQLWGGKKHNLPIISLDELKRYYADAVIVISPRYCWREIKESIIANELNNEILCFSDLLDEIVGVQYFSCPSLHHEKNEIFVDAGVLDGYTTRDFAQWAGEDYEFAYLFEPNPKVHELIAQNLSKNNLSLDNYRLINKGLWKNDADLCFTEGAEGNVGGFSVFEGGKSCNTVPMTTLDKELIDVPVTFIKMDIEGAEYNALVGGKELIKRYHPKLAICVYHKPEDIIDIPKLILELNSNYKFYLRHYSFSYTETVLYGMPD